ncbi:hypothetical protein HYX11_04175 [Candidatus Woesearchaeota archaeon]|nr:hypothetical protein [Candidatus Woesearchaeota archaeon]
MSNPKIKEMEKMERKLSGKKYLLAFILTIIIFSGGILIGIIIENARLENAKQSTLSEKVGLLSLQLQQRYIDSGIADCKSLNKILDTNLNELGKKMGIIIDYEKKSFFNQEEFDLQLRDYFLTEIQYFLLSQEIDRKCSQDNLKILYFYDENKYDTQGSILGYLKNKFGENILIFSFNSKFKEEPMINLLLTSYKINQFPSIVIENEILLGHQEIEELQKTICGDLQRIGKNLAEECSIPN